MRKKREISQPYDPPYGIRPATLSLVENIGEHLGDIKSDRIKTVQSTLEIE